MFDHFYHFPIDQYFYAGRKMIWDIYPASDKCLCLSYAQDTYPLVMKINQKFRPQILADQPLAEKIKNQNG